MSNLIVITLPHRLGAEEAKRRIAGGIEPLRRDYIDKLAYSEIAAPSLWPMTRRLP
jgi:hypothetical protein